MEYDALLKRRIEATLSQWQNLSSRVYDENLDDRQLVSEAITAFQQVNLDDATLNELILIDELATLGLDNTLFSRDDAEFKEMYNRCENPPTAFILFFKGSSCIDLVKELRKIARAYQTELANSEVIAPSTIKRAGF